MKKILTLLAGYIILSCCNLTSIQAQSKYGKITMEELQMDSYPEDTTAVAVILSKVGEVEFSCDAVRSLVYEYTLSVKIKILKPEGLDLSSKEIFYTVLNSRRMEIVKGLSGTTYNLENGKIERTKLSKDYIFEEKHDDQLKVKKFTMPAVKVGSVIEYKYTLSSPFDSDLRSFDFQSSVPTLYAAYKTTIPEYYTYNVNMQGFEKIDFSEKTINIRFPLKFTDTEDRLVSLIDDCEAQQRIFSAQNIPAIKDESFMWTTNDYITNVSYELRSFQFKYGKLSQFSSSWEKIDTQILESKLYGGNIKRESLFKKEVETGNTTMENATAILNMIRGKVKWNEKSGMPPSNLGNALKNGLGNSTDMNFLLINALKAGGFDAYPVLLSTRGNGHIPIANPSMSSFNYIITGLTVDEKQYFIDACSIYSYWNILPLKTMVSRARILKAGSSGWVDLSTAFTGITYLVSNYKFVEGEYVGSIASTERGIAAYLSRNHYYNGHTDKNNYIENLSKKLAAPVEDFNITNEENLSADVKISFTVKPDITLGDDFLYINPLFIKHRSDNPFKTETRKYPVNFDYVNNYVQQVTIEIPEGYEVEELPKSEKIIFDKEGSIALTYMIVHEDGVIRLSYQYSLKRLLVSQSEYETLRVFFSKVALKNAEQIVLKKV